MISSYAAYDVSTVIGPSSVTKTALLGLAKAFSKALFEDKIRVNTVCPGLIKTKFSEVLWKGNEEAAMKQMGVNRLGEPMDIGHAVKFLLSDEASYITGETLLVTGTVFPRL